MFVYAIYLTRFYRLSPSIRLADTIDDTHNSGLITHPKTWICIQEKTHNLLYCDLNASL